jgi:hypothetical protein
MMTANVAAFRSCATQSLQAQNISLSAPIRQSLPPAGVICLERRDRIYGKVIIYVQGSPSLA